MVGFLSQTHVGIILAEKYAVFRTRGKHAVWFIHPFCHEVINQHTDVCLIASQGKRRGNFSS